MVATDQRLTAVFQSDPSGQAAAGRSIDMTHLRQRARRDRLRRRAGLATIAATLVLAMLGGWVWMRGRDAGNVKRAETESLAAQLNDLDNMEGSAILTSPPPVAPLAVLANQQKALLAELKRWPVSD